MSGKEIEVFFGSQIDKNELKHNREKPMCLLKRLMFFAVLRLHFFPSGTSLRCVKEVMRPYAVSQLSTTKAVEYFHKYPADVTYPL